jgi:hypothetical protein
MNAKSIEELYAEYNAASRRASADYHKWNEAQCERARMGLPQQKYKDSFEGYTVDFYKFEKELGDIIQRDFNLTAKQRGYIMAEAYDRFHSSYGDMFWGAHGIAEFVTKFPKD